MEDGGEDGRWRGARRVWTGVRMEDGGERDGVWTGVDGGEDGRRRERDGVWTLWMGVRVEDGGERDGVWTGVDGRKGGSVRVGRGRTRSMFQGSSQHISLWFEICRKLRFKGVAHGVRFKGVAHGDDSGGKEGSRGWTEAVYEACFTAGLKHASLWAQILKKSRLKGMQMEMILGEREVDVGRQRSCTKHVSGLISNMFCCGVKYSGH